jgi:hypothetical protein
MWMISTYLTMVSSRTGIQRKKVFRVWAPFLTFKKWGSRCESPIDFDPTLNGPTRAQLTLCHGSWWPFYFVINPNHRWTPLPPFWRTSSLAYTNNKCWGKGLGGGGRGGKSGLVGSCLPIQGTLRFLIYEEETPVFRSCSILHQVSKPSVVPIWFPAWWGWFQI